MNRCIKSGDKLGFWSIVLIILTIGLLYFNPAREMYSNYKLCSGKQYKKIWKKLPSSAKDTVNYYKLKLACKIPDKTMFDAAFVGGSGNRYIYFFKGSKYWKYSLDKGTVNNGYPKLIKDVWDGIPNNLDAAFKREHTDPKKNNKIYFFKGSYAYKYGTNSDGDRGRIAKGKIKDWFKGVPNNIDAVWSYLNSSMMETIVFFKNQKKYRYQSGEDIEKKTIKSKPFKGKMDAVVRMPEQNFIFYKQKYVKKINGRYTEPKQVSDYDGFGFSTLTN